MTQTTALVLDELSEEERDERFGRLQERLKSVWSTMRLNMPGESIVVIPSVTPDPTTPGSIVQAHEERFLFLLLLLRQPRLRMIYVTSLPIAWTIEAASSRNASPARSSAARASSCG